jgi:hypothetical protein
MGRTYYEHTMPMLVKQMELLNQNLVVLTELIQQNSEVDRKHLKSQQSLSTEATF